MRFSVCVTHTYNTGQQDFTLFLNLHTEQRNSIFYFCASEKVRKKSPTSPLLAYTHKRQLEHICTVPVLGLLLLWQTPWPEARGGRVYFVFQLSGLHWRHVGQDLKQEPGMLLTGLRLIPSMATKLNIQLLYTIQDHGPKGSTTHNGLRSPYINH